MLGNAFAVVRHLQELFTDMNEGRSYTRCYGCRELTHKSRWCDECVDAFHKAFDEAMKEDYTTLLAQMTVPACCEDCPADRVCMCPECDGAWKCGQCKCMGQL